MPDLSPRERLLDLIGNGTIPPGGVLPSSRKLADDWGLGRTAVNYAVMRLVAEGTLQKKGYRVSVAKNTGEEGQVFPPIDFFTIDDSGRQTVEDIASRWGISVRSFSSDDDNLYRKELLELEERPSSGVLIRKAVHLDVLERLERKGIPVMLFGEPWLGHSFVSPSAAPFISIAVDHLAAMGHRHLAYLALPAFFAYPPLRPDVEEAYPQACQKAGLQHREGSYLVLSGDDSLSIANAWRNLCKLQPRPTAFLCENIRTVQILLGLAGRDGLHVPQDLSVLCLFEHEIASRIDPPVTTIGVDQDDILSLATMLMLQEIRRRRRLSGRARHHSVFCDPHLIRRESTGPAPGVRNLIGESTTRTSPEPAATGSRWPDEENHRRAQAATVNLGALELPGRTTDPQMIPLDLNLTHSREFSRRNSWLGRDPLKQFDTGRQSIHGITFDINSSALVLRSAHARGKGRVPLPDAAVIPVGRKVVAICILHAAGWVRDFGAFATYEFCYHDGRIETVPVIGLGQESTDLAEKARHRSQAIIQDWHYLYPQFKSSNALPYLITDQGDPLLYERYLYVYRFLNPHPGLKLKAIRVTTLNPEGEPTLAILAATAIVKRGRAAAPRNPERLPNTCRIDRPL